VLSPTTATLDRARKMPVRADPFAAIALDMRRWWGER
jgi:hypothetical protein